MDKDIERVAQLIKENTSSDGKAYCISETAACEMFDLAEDLASHLQASQARVAELEEAIGGVSIQLDTFVENSDDCIAPAHYINNVNGYLKDALKKDQ